MNHEKMAEILEKVGPSLKSLGEVTDGMCFMKTETETGRIIVSYVPHDCDKFGALQEYMDCLVDEDEECGPECEDHGHG